MKLTDFSLIFLAIFLPVVIIAYVNTSFVVESEKNEMYYKTIINSATKDAAQAMKEVESTDIDYGDSGIVDKKISINADEAIRAFYNSLANNFGIAGNKSALNRLKMYIPVVAVIDYDGVYIHSLEETTDGSLIYTTKPKIRYTYTYAIVKNLLNPITNEVEYGIIDVSKEETLDTYKMLSDVIYEVTFTLDDYIYLNVYRKEDKKLILNKGFYLTDMSNNLDLIYSEELVSEVEKSLREQIVIHLSGMRKDIIAKTGMKNISYAINNHNSYAKSSGIKYEFRFAVDSDTTWYETMNGIGVISVIQGISLGNRYLNYKSYSAAELSETKKYYASAALDVDTKEPAAINGVAVEKENRYYLEYNLYHVSKKCPVYEYYIRMTESPVMPMYYQSRGEAATQGYYACPICKP